MYQTAFGFTRSYQCGASSLTSPSLGATLYDDNEPYDPHSNYYYHTDERGDNAMQTDLLPSMQSVSAQALSFSETRPKAIRQMDLNYDPQDPEGRMMMPPEYDPYYTGYPVQSPFIRQPVGFHLVAFSSHRRSHFLLLFGGGSLSPSSSIITYTPIHRRTLPPLLTLFLRPFDKISRSVRKRFSLNLRQDLIYLKRYKATIRSFR